jgi:hypothetical protein
MVAKRPVSLVCQIPIQVLVSNSYVVLYQLCSLCNIFFSIQTNWIEGEVVQIKSKNPRVLKNILSILFYMPDKARDDKLQRFIKLKIHFRHFEINTQVVKITSKHLYCQNN